MASREITSVMRFSLIYTMIQCALMVVGNPMDEAPNSINFAKAVRGNIEAAPMGLPINFAPMGNPESVPMESNLYCKDAVSDIGNCCKLPVLIPKLEQLKCQSFVEETRDATKESQPAVNPNSDKDPITFGELYEKAKKEEDVDDNEDNVEEKDDADDKDNEDKCDEDDNEDYEDSDGEEKTPIRKGRSAEENEDGDIKTVYSAPPKVSRILMEPPEETSHDTQPHELLDDPNPELAMMTYWENTKEKRDHTDAAWGSGCTMDCVFIGLKLATREGKIDYAAATSIFKENSESAWHGHIEQAVMDCRDGVIKASAEAYVMQNKCRPNAQILLNCVNKKLALTCPAQFMEEQDATCSEKVKRVEMCEPFMIPPPVIAAGQPTFNNPPLYQMRPMGRFPFPGGFPGDPPSMNAGGGNVYTMMSKGEGPVYQAPMNSPEVMMPIMAPGMPNRSDRPNFRTAIMMKDAKVQNGKVFKNNNGQEVNTNQGQKSMYQWPKNLNQGHKSTNGVQNGKKQGQNIMNQHKNLEQGQKGKNQGQNMMNKNIDEGQKGKKQGQNHMTHGQKNDGQKDKNQGQKNINQGTKPAQNGRDGKNASRDVTNKAQGTRFQDKPLGEKDLKKTAGNPQMGIDYVKMSTPGKALNKSGRKKSILSNSNGPRDM